MVLTAVRGGLGFLSRVPIGHDKRAWKAFGETPVAFPLVGYLVGALLALPFVVPLPTPSVALLFVCWVYLVTGINHADALADLGDGFVVHGGPPRRRAVITDTTVGVGGILTLGIALLGLALAAAALADAPWQLLGLVIAAEVGAKLGMAGIACIGSAWHDGLGAAFTTRSSPRSLVLPVLVALPAGGLTAPHPAALVALVAAISATGGLFWWAATRLGGVNGDVFGASNEVARLAALHAGVITWMHW